MAILDCVIDTSPQDLALLCKWRMIFFRDIDQTAEQIYRTLERESELYGFHVKICNQLAMNGKALFKASYALRHGPPLLGVCSSAVRAGDQTLRIEGLPQLLIVRNHPASTDSVEIVSPAIIRSKARGFQTRNIREKYVKYQIR
jgi:hypothetical protein